jgi:hypothetical protein
LLRGIDCFFDLTELRKHLAPFYSHTGRPSIDPELMIRMLNRWLLLGHPVRASAMRGGPLEPSVSLVLSPWKTRCPITRPSPRIGMVASARAMHSAVCSRACCADA